MKNLLKNKGTFVGTTFKLCYTRLEINLVGEI